MFVSTSFRAARDQLRAFVSATGHSLAGIVEATTTGGVLNAANAAHAGLQKNGQSTEVDGLTLGPNADLVLVLK